MFADAIEPAPSDRFLLPRLIGLALVLPVGLGLVQGVVWEAVRFVFALALFVVPGLVCARLFYCCAIQGGSFGRSLFEAVRPVPPGLILGTDLNARGVPRAALALVLVNAAVFAFASEAVVEHWMFFPRGCAGIRHLIASGVTSGFLHKDLFHLLGNMVTLLALGWTLEPRIGSLRFLGLYLLCLVLSNLFVFVLLIAQAVHLDSDFLLKRFHSIGASGAVCGVLGLYAVRCFFSRLVVGVPFFFLPFVSIPVKIPCFVVAGAVLALDVAGSVGQFSWPLWATNFWSHLGGYLSGFAAGCIFGLHRQARLESLEVRARRLSRHPFEAERAAAAYRTVLARDPENDRALAWLGEYHHRRGEHAQAAACLAKRLRRRLKIDPGDALALADRHWEESGDHLPGGLLTRLGARYACREDSHRARQCLERAAALPGDWQPRALFVLAGLDAGAGFVASASKEWREIMQRFPDTAFAGAAKERLGRPGPLAVGR